MGGEGKRRKKMKKTLAVVAVVAVLGLATAAFAGWGFGPGGHMGPGAGYGYGHMMGYGYGPMMGYGGYGPMTGYGHGPEGEKFLKETADVRRELHQKRFEYSEALRTGDERKAAETSKDIETLVGQLREKAPEDYFAGGRYGRGPCW